MKVSLLLLICLFSNLVLAKTSREERSDKKYEITYQFGQDYRMNANQLSGMFFIDGDNLIGFKLGDGDDDRRRQTNVALQYKHYVGNSFYISGEVFYLNTRDDEDWVRNLFTNKEEYASYSSMGAGIRIGNQWTWKYFTLGCDWIGVGKRVGVFRRDYENSSSNTYTLLNVIAGISF
jgi:hypothetical protein